MAPRNYFKGHMGDVYFIASVICGYCKVGTADTADWWRKRENQDWFAHFNPFNNLTNMHDVIAHMVRQGWTLVLTYNKLGAKAAFLRDMWDDHDAGITSYAYYGRGVSQDVMLTNCVCKAALTAFKYGGTSTVYVDNA